MSKKHSEPLGKLTPDSIALYKDKILLILKDGGQIRDVNEWVYFYDKQNRYQGYCLKADWESEIQK